MSGKWRIEPREHPLSYVPLPVAIGPDGKEKWFTSWEWATKFVKSQTKDALEES